MNHCNVEVAMMTVEPKRDLQHYLVSIDAGGVHLHAYVMAPDQDYAHRAAERLVEIVEDSGRRFVPIILTTHLTGGVDLVREIISRRSEEAREKLKTATDYHLSIFQMPADDPDDARLMELH
jgi:hypothetical protein